MQPSRPQPGQHWHSASGRHEIIRVWDNGDVSVRSRPEAHATVVRAAIFACYYRREQRLVCLCDGVVFLRHGQRTAGGAVPVDATGEELNGGPAVTIWLECPSCQRHWVRVDCAGFESEWTMQTPEAAAQQVGQVWVDRAAIERMMRVPIDVPAAIPGAVRMDKLGGDR